MNLKFTKEQLESALEARRDWAQKMDKKRVAKHKRDEATYLTKFREKIREATKWDYETAKKRNFEVGIDRYNRRDRPECPEGVEMNLDRAISQVVMDGRDRYVISKMAPRNSSYRNNDTSHIYWLLTHDENAKADVCE